MMLMVCWGYWCLEPSQKHAVAADCDGDAAFLFLGHPVHRGGSVVDFADAVADAGVEQNAFGCGSFTGVDVSSDTDVASQREVFRHDVGVSLGRLKITRRRELVVKWVGFWASGPG